MNDKTPTLVIWFLEHVCPGDNHALAGDLIERFQQGKTRKQVLVAFVVAVPREMIRHWPYFGYATAGTALPLFLFDTARRTSALLHWWALPFPLSLIVWEFVPRFVLALAALPVLAVGLKINRSLHWLDLFRTAVFNLILITLAEPLNNFLMKQPALVRRIDSYHVVSIILVSTFLISAWLGCRRPARSALLV
jgi:hypothetical protein